MTDQTQQSDSQTGAPSGASSSFGDSLASSSERIEVIIEAAERAAAGILEDAETQARTYLEESRRRADEVADERAQALSGLADNLLSRVESVKEQSADLILALEAARAQIADHISDYTARSKAQATSRAVPHLKPVTPAPPSTPATSAASEEEAETEATRPEETESREANAPFDVEAGAGDAEVGEEEASGEADSEPETPVAPPPPQRPATEPSAGARLLATQMAVAGSGRAEIANRLEHEFGIADPESMLDAILGPRT